MNILQLESLCKQFIENDDSNDAAHDLAHVQRVVNHAKTLLDQTDANPQIVLTAAWLHDCVVLSKNHPDRKISSQLAAKKAEPFIQTLSFSHDHVQDILHAIEAHSFSGNTEPKTIEAKIVQDADRIDALGAIGIARCFAVGGELGTSLYNPDDPFCDHRTPNDSRWTVDHFYAKLFKLPETMNTLAGRKLAQERVDFMHKFLRQLSSEVL